MNTLRLAVFVELLAMTGFAQAADQGAQAAAAGTSSPRPRDSAEDARVGRALAVQDALRRHRKLLAEYLRNQLDSVAIVPVPQDSAALRQAAAERKAQADLTSRLPATQFDSAESSVKAFLAAPSAPNFATMKSRTTEYLAALDELFGLTAWKERVSPDLDERFRAAARDLATLVD